MKFNKYIWNLYKNLQKENSTIKYFKNLTCNRFLNTNQNDNDECPVWIDERLEGDFRKKNFNISITKLVKSFASKINIRSLKEANKLYASIVNKGIPIYQKDIKVCLARCF
jgi:hypothetical protein